MRLWLARLTSLLHLAPIPACLLLALAASARPLPAEAQTLRIVDNPVASAKADGIADADLGAMLTFGDKLRNEQRWPELIAHYKRAVEQLPNSAELKSRLARAQARADIERRYADPSFRRSVLTLTDREAIDLYSELLAKVQSHYVDTPDWSRLVRQGLLFAKEALFAERLRGLTKSSPQAFRALHAELERHLGSRVITDVRDAREAAWFAGQLAQQRTGLPAPALMLEFVAGATDALDPYSTFLTPDQLDEVFSQIEGNFVGIGIELDMEKDALRIVNVIPGGPAAQAGVRVGDRFVQLDGRTVRDLGPTNAANMLRGEEGTAIQVVADRGGEQRLQMQIFRRVVEVPSVVDVKIIDADNKTGYFKLASFQKSTSRDVDNALWTLHRQGMRSLIMDLRGNPGGLLDAAVQVADKFLTTGGIVSTRGRTEKFEFTAHQEGTWKLPVVVLIDGDSASASEILAGALRDHHRAHIMGTRSYGKGSVQGIFPLSIGRSGVRLTTAKFYSPSGRAISNNGVLPTKQARLTAKITADPAQAKLPANDHILSSAVRTAAHQASQPGSAGRNLGLTVSQPQQLGR